jgi:outer membrane lipoprotein SlyB
MKFSLKSRLLVSAALATLMVSGCSSTSAPRAQMMYVDASINSIDKAPKICTTDNKGRGNPIAGAIVGGLLGNQFGKGKGKAAMTLLGVGVGVGAAKGDKRSGSKLKCKSNGYIASVSFIDPQSGRVATDFVRLQKYTRVKALNIPVCLYPQGTKTCV